MQKALRRGEVQPLAGCLPMLLQVPALHGIVSVLSEMGSRIGHHHNLVPSGYEAFWPLVWNVCSLFDLPTIFAGTTFYL